MPKSEVETAVKNAVTKSRDGNIVLTTQLENQVYSGIMAAGGGGGGVVPELQDMKGILPIEKGGTNSTDASSARDALGAAADDKVVKLAGDQTIEGVKTLKRFLLMHMDLEKGTNPTSTVTKNIIMSDKNGTTTSGNRTSIAAFYGGVHDSGEAYADMRAFKYVAGSDDKAVLSVHCLKDGTKSAKAPTPAATASGQEIVTAEWVRAYSGGGQPGPQGDPGATFTPTVSASGIISWTNNGGLPDPEPVNILGPVGPRGEPGPQGTMASPEGLKVYSEDELVVGTWLGKPLYRRVFSGSGVSITSAVNLTNSGNIENLISQCGWVSLTSNPAAKYPLPTGVVSNLATLRLVNSDVEIFATGYTISAYQACAEYTKTTD